ncbi:WD40 repeat-like protein [Phialemonium atrogriseum]|uniref:WD40 repeat-like protein n=1 Tax=Phialemonium atrogriseum TaxID=1093897 RepID=A0AAJ0FGZ1_9PEZI|nr:WD40 repeat-like protein [Phialemonium atrogriseum]KAK1767127.1 WD40 repeat-like protein [Phialemonium atrogriseum]
MKNTPLIINWHDQNAPIYSAHFEPHGKGRLATAAGDNNVRLWKIEGEGEDRRVEYLSTLSKHTQAVNVVRWAPRGELLASAGDDGNVILWVPSDNHLSSNFGSDGLEENKETWRAKHMCRSSGAEIYDLAWSPDAAYFIIGSMDNIARIYNAGTGTLVRQIAEHSHYVQGVAWDPLNEFIATQSSDRSVHVYSLRTKDGQYTLNGHDDKPSRIASHMKTDLPARRISSHSPAPPEMGYRSALAALDASSVASPVPSAPGTPTSIALPMNPPSVISHSRRSSFSSRRSVSPAPSMPLPAVMPMEASPKPHSTSASLGFKNASLYANETLTSFFRRLTFTPDGSLLLTPAGQYQTQHPNEGGKPTYEVTNTVYIYTRGGINKAPVAHLPGHKKPSVAVRCSPLFYTLRQSPVVTKHITIDSSSAEDPIPSLPEPLTKASPAPSSVMDPPPPPPATETSTSSSKNPSLDTSGSASAPKPAISLPYRMVYAVATQDSVFLYDTQQQTPICIVSNLHCATFTDLAWSSDGLTLLVSSSDGFCSTLSFSPSELGQIYTGEIGAQKAALPGATSIPSNQNTPVPTPTAVFAPPSPFPSGSHHRHRDSAGSLAAASPPSASFVSQRASSPARSNSVSSVVTQSSTAQAGVISNPSLIIGQVPSIAATNSGKVIGVPMTTPPETPQGSVSGAGAKRDTSESELDDPSGGQPKRRRIAPTLVSGGGGSSTDSGDHKP